MRMAANLIADGKLDWLPGLGASVLLNLGKLLQVERGLAIYRTGSSMMMRVDRPADSPAPT